MAWLTDLFVQSVDEVLLFDGVIALSLVVPISNIICVTLNRFYEMYDGMIRRCSLFTWIALIFNVYVYADESKQKLR